jgi:hypothetical protein
MHNIVPDYYRLHMSKSKVMCDTMTEGIQEYHASELVIGVMFDVTRPCEPGWQTVKRHSGALTKIGTSDVVSDGPFKVRLPNMPRNSEKRIFFSRD